MYSNSGVTNFTASPGTFTSATVIAQSNTINNITDYVFNFRPKNNLLNDSYFKKLDQKLEKLQQVEDFAGLFNIL